MKRFFLPLSLFLISTTVYAGNSVEKEYEIAIQEYKEKNFASSYERFSKLYLTKLSDAKLNFYMGRSAYESGNYEMALAAFERVEMLEPSNLRNKLEKARTYFMLKMYEDSESAFKEVLANPNIPQNVRTNIELYLSKVTKVQQKSFTYATVNLDLIYDSNVNYGSLDSDYNINVGALVPVHSDIVSDMAVQAYADLTNIYDIGDKNGFAIKNRFAGFVKRYFKENDYDMSYISYEPGLLYSNTRYLAELALGVDNVFISDENYMQSFAIIPRFQYAHTTTLKSLASLRYQRKSFQRDAEKDLDAEHYELSYGVQKILSPSSYVQGTLTGINEAKLQGSRVDVDYTEYKVSLAYANQFTAAYATDLFAEYRKRDYSDYNPLFTSKRADNGLVIAADFNANVFDFCRLHLKGVYNRVESNQERYAYEKYTVTLGLNKTF